MQSFSYISTVVLWTIAFTDYVTTGWSHTLTCNHLCTSTLLIVIAPRDFSSTFWLYSASGPEGTPTLWPHLLTASFIALAKLDLLLSGLQAFCRASEGNRQSNLQPPQPIVFQPCPATSNTKLQLKMKDKNESLAHTSLYFDVSACWRSWIRRRSIFTPVPLTPAERLLVVGTWTYFWAGWFWRFSFHFRAQSSSHCSTLFRHQVRPSGQERLGSYKDQPKWFWHWRQRQEERCFSPATTFSVFNKWVMCSNISSCNLASQMECFQILPICRPSPYGDNSFWQLR